MGELRVQFCRQAAHASVKLSALSPGRSAQVAIIHLLLALVKTGGVASRTVACGGGAEVALLETTGGTKRGGVVGCAFFGEEQAVKSQHTLKQMLPKMHERRRFCMGLILLEALLALVLLVLIVWWTMFSGRDKGELKPDDKEERANKSSNKE